ncbi:uncharacterized protein TM35_000162070 [Trypanosoma theileri]|uniref:Uncharacterized protein n=1 Tax=Trypanosoma theileri TaxID=67003 RepID=A0A1X0NWK4_9TRYP|nr:uncharacterized protein TM35_000162070 [Trypanosoma theileri]ORC88569.1 hypothetical protein TM35_000162070 [Trypanosoma theileri]
MPRSCSVKDEEKGFSQRKKRIGADNSTNCLILHSFDSQDPVSMTCVADIHQPGELCDKLQPLITFGGSEEGTVMAFQSWNGKPVKRTKETDMASVTALLVIPSHSWICCGDEKGGITIFRLSVGREKEENEVNMSLLFSSNKGHSSSVTCFATDGDNFVYSGSIDGILISWKLQETINLNKKIGHHTGELSQILTVGNKYLLSVGPNSPAIHVWPLGGEEKEKEEEGESTQNPFSLRGHTGGVLCSLYLKGSRNGDGILWSGGDDCFIRIWDLNNPVHLNSRIASNSKDVKIMMKDNSLSEYSDEYDDDEMDDSMQDNSIRMLIGHKRTVVALREAHGIVFSCDVSGSFLAWNPHRYWLLHAFSVPLGRGLQRTPSIVGNNNDVTEDKETFNSNEIVYGARCLGFMEGFYWIIDTLSGPQSVYMPNHPRLRKSLSYSEVDNPETVNEIIDESVMMNRFVNYVQETLDFFLHYIGTHSEIFATSVNAQLLERNDKKKELLLSTAVMATNCYHVQSLSSPVSFNNPIQEKMKNDCNDIIPSVHSNFTDVNNLQTQQMDLERERQRLQKEAMHLDDKVLAVARLEAELIEMKKQQESRDAEREDLLRSLMKREQEREQQLAQVSTELSFLRLKYADWGSVVEKQH